MFSDIYFLFLGFKMVALIMFSFLSIPNSYRDAAVVRDDRPGIPQLFTSLPVLNEAASYFAESSIFSCFPDISIRPVFNSSNEQEMVSFASEEERASTANANVSSSGSASSAYELIDTKFDAPVAQGEITRSSTADSSQTSTALINTNQNGIPIFQGLLEKVRRTVCGSADDIGWLQKATDMPPVEDGTERFTELLDDISWPFAFLYQTWSAQVAQHHDLFVSPRNVRLIDGLWVRTTFSYNHTRSAFRSEASHLIAKSPVQEAPKSLLSFLLATSHYTASFCAQSSSEFLIIAQILLFRVFVLKTAKIFGCTPILDMLHALGICARVARGIAYLHEEVRSHIVHRDIKARNA
ncbi:hypothetical protein ACS0TY_021940 [Phlomoides rotata]